MKINLDKIKKGKTIDELFEFCILNVDKPSGPTSFQVVEKVKEILGVKKTSHFGTLDPKVTGVLPVALNKACRLAPWFIKKDKTYIGVMKLHDEVSDKKLKGEMKKFVGKIIQLPPVRSRVKRAERERTIYKFEILERQGKSVLFFSDVEAGTYIRKLVHDLGERLGGAHMAELRRTKAGIFSETDKGFANLYDLEKAVEEWKEGNEKKIRDILIPGEVVSKILPVVQMKKDSIGRLLNGSPIMKEFVKGKIKEKDGNVVVFCDGRFVGVYNLKKEGEIIARPEFVFKPVKT